MKAEIQDEIDEEVPLFSCCEQHKNPEKLFNHIKGHHLKEATKCVFCGKKLSSKSSLDRHLLTHAKWQPYKCATCDRLFSTNGNMNRHNKTHKKLFNNLQCNDNASKDDDLPMKNSKKNSSLSSHMEDETEELTPIDRTKRKRLKTSCSEQKNMAKKMKSDSAKSSRNGTKTLPQIEMKGNCNDVSEETNQSSDSCVSSSLSKEEYISSLGLQAAIKHNHKSCCDDKFDITTTKLHLKNTYLEWDVKMESPTNIQQIEKDEKDLNSVNGQLIIDCDRENNDFTEVTAIVSNITEHPQERETEMTFRTYEEDEFKKNHWTPESPETSIDDNTLIQGHETNEVQQECQEIKKFFCKHCKKNFKNKNIFQKHMLIHNKAKPFKCLECNAKFPNKPNAMRHVKKVHKMQSDLAKTLIVYNVDSRDGIKIVCEWCGKDFTSNLILEHHKRASEGCRAKPFVCLLCNKSFSTKNNGKRHLTTHHKEESAMDYIVQNNIAPINGNLVTSATSMNSSQEEAIQDINALQKLDSNDSDALSEANSIEPEHIVETNNNNSLIMPEIFNKSFSTKNNGKRCFTALQQEELAMNCIVQNNIASRNRDPLTSATTMDRINEEKNLNMNAFEKPISADSNDLFEAHSIKPARIVETNEVVAVQSLLLIQETPVILPPNKGKEILQDGPLDLSVKPIDLTAILEKVEEKRTWESNNSSKNLFKISSENEFLSQPVSQARKRRLTSDSPLNLAKKRNEGNTSSKHSTPEVKTKESNVSFSVNVDGMKSSQVQCDFCPISFANNSNKRRHEKKKHPQQETVSTLSYAGSPLIDSNPAINFNNNLTTKSVLSKKTKFALLKKRNYAKPNEKNLVSSVNRNNEENLLASNNESENGDLASVSSLINTANSPQLKKYLTSDSNGDVSTSPIDIPVKVNLEADNSTNMLNNKHGIGKYKCSLCNKDFPCKSSYDRHSVTHTHERPYFCQQCPQTFTTKSNRDRHLKLKHHYSSEDLKALSAKKSISLVSNESSTNQSILKDSPILIHDVSQCNKENHRLPLSN